MKVAIHIIMKLIFLIVLLLSSCSSTTGIFRQRSTIVVPDDYETIQDAIDNAQDRDIIYIKKGIYKGNIQLSKPVSLIGESPEDTIILPDATSNKTGIDISFSDYGIFLNTKNTSYVEIKSLQIRNFQTGIHCSYKDIGSINNCILVSANAFDNTLWLQGTKTPIINCTLIGGIHAYDCRSQLENNIITFLPLQGWGNMFENAIDIKESPEMKVENNVIWGECTGLDDLNNIFANPEFTSVENLQFESIYSADLYGAKIEGKKIEKESDMEGPVICLPTKIKDYDLNIIEKKDLLLELKISDKSPIREVIIETEKIDCLSDFKFERVGYIKELTRTLILQPGYNSINISSEDIHGNFTSKSLNFQLGVDSIPRSSWVDTENDPPPMKYPKKIGLSIGIQDYPIGLNTLEYAENDAIIMNQLLEAHGYDIQPILLNPTLNELKQSLIDLEKIEKDFDKVVIYISGHGANESTIFSNSYGLILPKDIDINNLSLTSFPMEDFRNYIKNLEAKTVIVILDMCFSSGGKGYGSIPKDIEDDYITNMFRDTGQGKILLASSGDKEQSFEDADLKHGVFTYFLVEAVNNGLVSIDSIYNYIYENIQDSHKWTQRPRKVFLSDDIEGYHTLF